jgi:hypothetical protein
MRSRHRVELGWWRVVVDARLAPGLTCYSSCLYQNMGSVAEGPGNIRDGLSVVCVAYIKSASQCCPHFPSAVTYLSEPGQGADADSDTLPR